MKQRSYLIAFAVIGLVLAACATVEPEFADDWTLSDYFRAGQTAYAEQGNADLAIAYYEEIFSRFPDTQRLVEADYEIGFVLYKKGSTDEAAARFERVLSYYPNPDIAQWPKVLAEKLLREIEG
jgi:outer membrane protein assembly factor BamD (BamD/ComL family)